MKLQLAVLWCGGRWTLLAPSVRYDRYLSRQSALDAAQRIAGQARQQGYDVQVLVQEIGGELTQAPSPPWSSEPSCDAASPPAEPG